MKKTLLLLALLGGSIQLFGQINSLPGSHNWSSTSAWSGGIVPSPSDEVNITANSTITLDVPVAHENNINVLNGGSLQSMNPSNDLTITTGDLWLESFGSIVNFISSSAVPVTIIEGHLLNDGVFMAGDVLLDNNSGVGNSYNNGDFMCQGDMIITGTEFFENNLGMSVNGNLLVDVDCEFVNNMSVNIGSVLNEGTFENADATTIQDSLINNDYFLSDGYYTAVNGDLLNTGDAELFDSIQVSGDFMNSGTFENIGGVIHIANDFWNDGIITGDSAGYYQIGAQSENDAAGVINGNIDICDTSLTDQYLDILAGTVDFNTVTFCSVSYASIDGTVDQKLTVFPNPTNGVLNFNGIQNAPYVILSSDGRIVQEGIYSNSIDVSPLASGLYFIQVNADNYQYKTSFTKK